MPRRYNKMPPLTARAEKALWKTIELWTRIASGENVDEDCPLCVAFPGDDDCDVCPVNQRMPGEKFCIHVPAWRRFNGTKLGSVENLKAAKACVRFLRDTLRLGLAARGK